MLNLENVDLHIGTFAGNNPPAQPNFRFMDGSLDAVRIIKGNPFSVTVDAMMSRAGIDVPDCTMDSDDDGVPDNLDNCPADPNPIEACSDDGDCFGPMNMCNVDDLCTQQDDNDGDGDVCDAADADDSVIDPDDNCPLVANLDQSDIDFDDIGDPCDSVFDAGGVLGHVESNATDVVSILLNADSSVPGSMV